MNKLYLWGGIITVAMLGATYWTIALTKGGLNGDIVNMLAIAGAVALVLITVWVVVKYVRQMQNDTVTGELADENWDGIGEYKNDLPIGWSLAFMGTMIWGMWYWLAGYPVNAFSQIGQYNEEVKEKNAQFQAEYANIKGDRLVEMGEAVYLAECKVCHGINADGIDGKAANLNQRIEKKSVVYTIKHGSNNHLLGVEMPMPDRNGLFNANTGALITDAEIDTVASYVANGFKGAGADIFAGTCASCHGADGRGISGVAPNIREFTPQLVANVLTHGKKAAIGRMPAINRLNAKQKEAVGAYVTSLSKGE
jgi:cytochrome c oxidase cbb3-type subunit 3